MLQLHLNHLADAFIQMEVKKYIPPPKLHMKVQQKEMIGNA